MSTVSNPYTFNITSNRTFKTATLAAAVPGTRLGPYKYNLIFYTRTNGYAITIDNTSLKYLSVEYDCWRETDTSSSWWYKLYLADGTNSEDVGDFSHSSSDDDPKCSLTKIS